MFKTGIRRWWEDGKTVLVLGSGVAGVSAAMWAAGAYKRPGEGFGKPRVILIDKEPAPFARQRRSQRELEPVGYDWPHPHWEQPSPPGGLLPYVPSRAVDMALSWTGAFLDFKENHPNLEHYPSSQLPRNFLRRSKSGRHGSPWRVKWFDSSGTLHEANVDLVVNCTGFGNEAVRFSDGHPGLRNEFISYPYWQDDHIGKEGFAISGEKPRFLIAGGGDGAIQDLLRILTGKTGIGLLKTLGRLIPPEILVEINLAEEHAARLLHYEHSLLPSPRTATVISGIHANLSGTHTRLASKLIGESQPFRDAIQDLIRAEWRPLIGRATSPKPIALHYGEPHLGRCYAANHFFARVFLQIFPELIDDQPSSRILAAEVQGTSNTPTPAECWGRPMRVGRLKTGQAPEVLDGFNAIINRIGIDPVGQNLPGVVQMLPFACHWWDFPHTPSLAPALLSS